MRERRLSTSWREDSSFLCYTQIVMKKGFTLIELLVVISIISLLSSVVLSSLNAARDKARLGAARSFAAQTYRVAGDYAVGQWEFDETGGTVASDRSGNGNNGALVNGPTWSTDTPWDIGRSLQLDGSNDYVQVPHSPALAPTSAISFGTWFKANNTTASQKIISKTNGGGYQLSLNENSVCPASTYCALVHVAGTYYSASVPISAVSPGKWHHGFASYDGDTLKLFLDGKLVATNSNPSGSLTYASNNTLCLGNEPGAATCSDGEYFGGYIDDARVYAKALAASEVGELYASARGRYEFAAR